MFQKVFLTVLLSGCLGVGLNVARADDGSSILVTTAAITQGSLPQVVTMYGSIATAAPAQQTLVAPLQAQVRDVYVRAGAVVAQGAPLLRFMPTPASELAYTQAESAAKLATALQQRTETLVMGHMATDQQLFQANKDAADARATLASLKAQGADGPHIMRAPFKAIVTSVNAAPGAVVAAGDALVGIAPPDKLELAAGVVPDQANAVNVGDAVVLTPIGQGPAINGKVSFRAAVVEASNGLVPVDIEVLGGQAMLGEMFRADVTVGQVSGYIVPHDAVLVNPAGQTYIVQDNKGAAKFVVVQVLNSTQDQDVVRGPVDINAPVIRSGNYQLNDGDKIRLSDDAGDSGK
ncbi:MAG: hypothetical protein B7Z75_07615 [Acidocella sp. 20-57-95]|nr:MAG: hypothetical protein B7Z75_07615 [Acidocella sp. 20-57-95]OYV61543.1 MAG: hypothetical protein B7Z71_04415 [Acidocella sp. 21-58-7]HQT62920.1 HlyD family efflux transporter periplasmic adaptor subunit [Acidocella sp.]HQU03986.1 HlyD family efflux transporter periplasmic adaptor subunit [Acidocella sp.]